MSAFGDSLRGRFRHWKQLKRIQSIYKPVDSSRKEIRLLEVALPGAEGLVQCKVKYASLLDDPKPRYETISYCWGDASFTEKVLLDGKIVYVPQNTELALRNVVTPGRGARTIWQDFLCINQNDISERSQQVAIMGEIYSSSEGNLIFHGSSPLSNELMADIQKIVKDIKLTIGPYQDSVTFMRSTTSDFYRIDSSLVWTLANSLDQDGLREFFDSSWLVRTWIWQEILVAPSNKLFWGPLFSSDLDDILQAAGWLYDYHLRHVSSSLYKSKGLYSACGLWAIRSELQRDEPVLISSILENMYSRQATDERDKIFAIIGVTQERHSNREIQKLLLPDYGKSLRDVYRDATRYCIEEMASIVMLSNISHRDGRDMSGVDFPSWAIRFDRDWDPERDSRALSVQSISLKGIQDNDQVLISVLGSLDSDALQLWGWHFDVIQMLSLADNAGLVKGLDVESSYQFFEQILDTFGSTTNDYAAFSTIARTLIANTNAQDEKSQPRDWNGFAIVLEDFKAGRRPLLPQNLSPETEDDKVAASNYHQALRNSFFHRRLSKTKSGYLGLVPKLSRANDVIAILKWSPWPAVLRPRSDGDYSFVGLCYIDELRNSRMVDLIGQGNFEWIHYKIR